MSPNIWWLIIGQHRWTVVKALTSSYVSSSQLPALISFKAFHLSYLYSWMVILKRNAWLWCKLKKAVSVKLRKFGLHFGPLLSVKLFWHSAVEITKGFYGKMATNDYYWVRPVVRECLLLSGWFAATKKSKHVYLDKIRYVYKYQTDTKEQ